MPARNDSSDHGAILLSGAPLMDTRAPVEFARGAFPGAVNLPLINDQERHEIGIRYKQQGQQAAIDLGNELVSGKVREQRIQNWSRFARENAGGYLYCFRGGLRSQTVQSWLREQGIHYPLIIGGYKAMRRWLLEALPKSLADLRPVLISGKTGTGKTRVVEALDTAIDLEGLAQHRGSTFGRLLNEQPSQIDFENALSLSLARAASSGKKTIFLEDEGKLIGRLSLPDELRLIMQSAPMVVIEEGLTSRVDVVMTDYIEDLGNRFSVKFGEQGSVKHEERLRGDLAKIKKRLGGLLYQELDTLLLDAFSEQRRTGNADMHRLWIEALLVKYYDPMYDYQFSKRSGQVVMRGSRTDVLAYARQS